MHNNFTLHVFHDQPRHNASFLQISNGVNEIHDNILNLMRK